ncbi:molecular chaperone [Pseudomonas fontis]|uniref:Molecular chaperone n=1 Tax=Pseudomonas fontis TaxID=2942633 RepID=A0ABT5NU92_9PSED|nr:molecular chaperone [Pseudomonas fontis]MDD0977346.1 molecular chaperone [Pseudomonas fontis]MDD0991714.1 molecular chaperone [Pseudomonas fontis]
MPGLSHRPAPVRRGALSCALFGALLCWLPTCQGALTVNGTRIVFDSDKRSVSATVSNPSNKAFAVQTWVNTAADDQTTAVPFIASPPLFRLNAGKEQQVQINGLPNSLPTDRETVFFFNVQEIPQTQENQANQLNIALRTRIKLFYRPVELASDPLKSLEHLTWSVRSVGGKPRLEVNNPGPYHQSFVSIELSKGGQTLKLAHTPMVMPLATQHFELEGFKPGPGLQVKFITINDYGGFTTPLTSPVAIDL